AEVREYQYVRPLLQHAERIRRAEDVLVHRGIGLHLAIDDERRVALPQNRDRFRDLLRLRMAHGSKVGKRQHRDLRRDAKSLKDAAPGIMTVNKLTHG